MPMTAKNTLPAQQAQSPLNKPSHLDDNLGQASVPAVNQYLQLAREQQLDTHTICQSVGVSEKIFEDNSAHITGLQFQALISALLHHTQDDLFGLHTAKYVQPGSYSVLGYISMNCENLGQAIEKIIPFEKLVGDMGTTEFEMLGDQVKIKWLCQFTDQHVKRHMIDNCLASWLTFARYLVNQNSAPDHVNLTREKPNLSQQNQYQAVFRCPINYGQKENAIIFPSALLSLPFNKGDQQILSTLESHASELISNLHPKASFVEQVALAIKRTLKSGDFRQQDIAKTFDISAKTLQRRLTSSRTSFQTVLDQTRLEVAKHLLASTKLNLSQVSSELGFTEPRSFYRWFNKLTEKTPGQYRESITE